MPNKNKERINTKLSNNWTPLNKYFAINYNKFSDIKEKIHLNLTNQVVLT